MPESPRCFAISITPFGAGGEVDEAAFRRHLSRLVGAGVGVYVGGGGSGEGYTLSGAEVRRLQEIAVDQLPAGAPVRAMGVEPRSAAEMSRFLAGAAAAGLGAAQVYSLDVGHGHRPSPAELERYLTEVLDSTALGCVVSTHQSVGYRIPVDLLVALAGRFEHLIGVNCTQPDVAYLDEVVRALDGRCEVHVGGPGQALTALALGARGFLSSEANLAPSLCAALGDALDGGDARALMRNAATVLRLSNLLYGHGGIRATKAVMHRLGLVGAATRPPRLPLEGSALDQLMEQVRLLGLEEHDTVLGR
ncbi:MAG: dihydrodipicolinate synthase family protein [Actinomycetota bacterium]|nr:dihydrodipicolinate synthase family protein [Actinomycetota bacterium]